MMNNVIARILPLQGGCNFRDLGGYRTRDGQTLAWRKVFRTGVLSYLTADDRTTLGALGVRAICDLRRADEREREPTRWSNRDARALSWDDGSAPPTIRALATRHANTAAGMHRAMCDLYRALPTWMAPRLRGMFECIANREVPIVVHCAAGKDRTGIAIALLMAALDIPHDTIMTDYLLTNDAGDFEQFILTRHAQSQDTQLGLATVNHPLLALPEDVRQVLFAAHPEYLENSFDQIAQDHGDVQTFLREVVGVDDALRERLRAELLTR